ncbi:hypothetical protein [Candidatus Reidiella endopervernicosa]|uniref:Uncharacterized protein n=1 Tax=Candidatus Reidiella endopervernicosa TaxID=2738883 RepID=A0A6N0HWX7_9GAMM|nr:hypothetical protein [Candidatus Reidiella endopervernicosa]QKQ26880.1 hypothetical protein HUE57_11780 [Candidatus Reidiella endopervernicosa]
MNSNESNKQPLELVPLDEENNSPAIANFGQKDDGEYIGHDRRFAFTPVVKAATDAIKYVSIC